MYDTGVSQYVFVEATEGHFVPRRVELGPTVGDQVVVNKGLAEGENVVVDGNFLLDSESQLTHFGVRRRTSALRQGNGDSERE